MTVGVLLVVGIPTGMFGILLALIWSSHPRVMHPSCRHCRYNISRSQALRCAECGADIHRVGVITPGMGRIPRAARRAVVNACMVWISTILLGSIVMWITSIGVDQTIIARERITIYQPLSTQYISFSWTGERRVRAGQVRYGPHCLRIRFHGGRVSRPLCVTPSARHPVYSPYQQSNPEVESIIREQDLSMEEIRTWARREGLNPDDPAIALELEEIRRVATTSFRNIGVINAPDPTQFTGTPRLDRLDESSRTWIAILAGLAAGALWCAFALLLWWRRHRRFLERCREAAHALIPTDSAIAAICDEEGPMHNGRRRTRR